MRHLATALVLACVLSGTASAGEIPTVAGDVPGTDARAPQDSILVLTIVLTLLSIVR